MNHFVNPSASQEATRQLMSCKQSWPHSMARFRICVDCWGLGIAGIGIHTYTNIYIYIHIIHTHAYMQNFTYTYYVCMYYIMHSNYDINYMYITNIRVYIYIQRVYIYTTYLTLCHAISINKYAQIHIQCVYMHIMACSIL